MISHKHKCIFIHIPKAAGTSIENYFLNDLNLDIKDHHALILGKRNNLRVKPRVVSHLSAIEMLSQHYISEEIFNSYYKFSIVRDPVQRLHSTYNYWGFKPIISFDVFVKTILLKLLKTDRYNFFLRPQTEYLFDETNNTNVMDFTGKFETLSDDFRFICNQLGFSDSQLPHKNKAKTKHKFSRSVKNLYKHPELIKHANFSSEKALTLSNQSRQIIEELYSDDFNNFNYSFSAI